MRKLLLISMVTILLGTQAFAAARVLSETKCSDASGKLLGLEKDYGTHLERNWTLNGVKIWSTEMGFGNEADITGHWNNKLWQSDDLDENNIVDYVVSLSFVVNHKDGYPKTIKTYVLCKYWRSN